MTPQPFKNGGYFEFLRAILCLKQILFKKTYYTKQTKAGKKMHNTDMISYFQTPIRNKMAANQSIVMYF